MNKQRNQAMRALRKIIGQTQTEFAAMVGVSKDAVASWETGRNQLSATFARRIALVTGVDGRVLHLGVSVPLSDADDGHVYTAEDFKRHQETEWGEEAGARRLKYCVDTLELLLRAAVQPGGEKIRHRLPGVMDSFLQWCERTREDFQLGPEIDAQLETRRRKVGMTQPVHYWRRVKRENPEVMKAAGYVENPAKRDREELRLELELVPGWSPGRSMKWPKPAIMKPAMRAH
jgi:transcriptional regulator with XRE-family HTH domain